MNYFLNNIAHPLQLIFKSEPDDQNSCSKKENPYILPEANGNIDPSTGKPCTAIMEETTTVDINSLWFYYVILLFITVLLIAKQPQYYMSDYVSIGYTRGFFYTLFVVIFIIIIFLFSYSDIHWYDALENLYIGLAFVLPFVMLLFYVMLETTWLTKNQRSWAEYFSSQEVNFTFDFTRVE